MKDTQEELERIQEELLSEDTTLEELLNDQELNNLLWETETGSADPQPEPPVYSNYANNYGKNSQEESTMSAKSKQDEKIIIGLMAAASVLSLGIIGVLTYWLTVLL